GSGVPRRTGMRKGEFVNLTTDAIVQIGSSFWLHVPVGKLHTDRYIPLHPQHIADRTVADEYFSVSEKVEALYDQKARELPADAEGAEMAKLRRQMHQRMLGTATAPGPSGSTVTSSRSASRAPSS
ncbi:MAG: hypothetical protein ACRDIC_01330, partial [bacterium]